MLPARMLAVLQDLLWPCLTCVNNITGELAWLHVCATANRSKVVDAYRVERESDLLQAALCKW